MKKLELEILICDISVKKAFRSQYTSNMLPTLLAPYITRLYRQRGKCYRKARSGKGRFTMDLSLALIYGKRTNCSIAIP